MPFKSEKQRKYLWANEPEIARDWTDTYGSGIQAAQGGRIGYQMGNMVEGEMEGAMMQSQEAIKELYDALIAEGLSPQEAMKKIKEIIAGSQTEEPESPMMGEEFPGQEFDRTPAAFGGIMDTYTGRRKYGLGSFIKKAVRKIKKIAKSPIGKAALLYAGTAGLGNLMAPMGGGTTLPWQKFGWLKPSAMRSAWLGTPGGTASKLIGSPGGPSAWTGKELTSGILGKGGPLGKYGLTRGAGSLRPTALGIGTAATLAPFAMQATGNWKQDQLPGPNIAGQEFDFDYGQMRKDIADAVAGGDYNEFTEVLGNYGLTEGANIPYWGSLAHGAEGGRVNAQEGGLMNLGGMEKDYRNDGGFVPIGGEEKADDVPARLSRNEFVFTADAVRNAGGGDIDKGAEVMENVMKNLEGGGQISEESQGQGAQEMFETSERLSEVV
jgi:hypothetical protein